MIELIIEVTKELLEHIDEPCNDEDLLRYIIKQGKPLPEHHGKISDVNKIAREIKEYQDENHIYDDAWDKVMEILDEAETILPATKGE